MESKVRLRSLARSADFLSLRANGQSFHVNSWLLVNLQVTNSREFRLGWTIPRQVGPAVVRNRLRRWGREFLRAWVEKRNQGLDLNVVLKRREAGFYKKMSHKEFDGALERMVAKVERHVE